MANNPTGTTPIVEFANERPPVREPLNLKHVEEPANHDAETPGNGAVEPARALSWIRRFGRWKHRLAAQAAVPLSRMYGQRVRGAFGILMYHRVANVVPGIPAPTWNVTPARFHDQLAGLLARGFIAWPLRRALDVHRRGREIPPRVFVVTFDDGYENNFTQAYPILRDLGIPATMFVATGFIDSNQPFPFDDWTAKGETAPESWRPLTTDQCLEMHESGLIELACHTHRHLDFRNRHEEFAEDLRLSRHFLEKRFGITDPTFAFPYGTRKTGFSGPALAEVCRQVGFDCSLTTESQLVLPGNDPFDWGRFTAENADTSDSLAGKLDGWYSVLRGAWQIVRRPFGNAPREESNRVLTAAHLPKRHR